MCPLGGNPAEMAKSGDRCLAEVVPLAAAVAGAGAVAADAGFAGDKVPLEPSRSSCGTRRDLVVGSMLNPDARSGRRESLG